MSGIVVDAPQQDGLAQQRDAGIDQPAAGGARRRRQLARVVGVKHDVGRFAVGLERAGEIVRDPVRLRHRHARMPAQHLDVVDGREGGDEAADAPRRQDQRVAAGQHHLPDLRP